MINLRQELENYPFIDLKNILEISPNISDNVKNSIVLYNKALESLKIDSEDIAIIELKKAVAINPNFHEAMNLLGLCYSYTKEYVKAIEIFEKVVAAENNSVQAIRYLNLLNAGTGQTITADSKAKAVRKNNVARANEKDSSITSEFKNIKINWTRDISKHLIGFTAGVILILLITFGVNAFSKSPETVPIDTLDSSKSEVSQEPHYKTKYDELNDKFTALQSEVSKANSEVDYYKNAIKLFEVDKLVEQKNLEAAADMLILLKAVSFKNPEKQKFDSLYSDVMPKASAVALNTGIMLMNSKKYQEGLEKLNKINIYLSDWTYMDRTLYYIGKCYMSLQDSRNAIAVFKQLKDKYPNSKYSEYANSWIRSLTQNP